MKRTGSVAVKKKIHVDPTWRNLITFGEELLLAPGRPAVGLLNANHFNYGIANLGAQTIAQYLLQRDINVYFAFADTIKKMSFINDPTMSPRKCDIIALSIPFEDTYLQALQMLEQIGFPINAQERGDEFPLVVAGGMAMINPIPFSEFVDVAVIGEGREALHEITSRYVQARRNRLSKRDAISELADIPGVYIPSHYKIEVDDSGYVTEFTCLNGHPYIESNLPLDMNKHPMFSVWTSKYASYEQEDYFSIMSAMGCHKKCPFCVVGHVQGARSGRALTMDEDVIINLALERRERFGTNLIKIFFSSAFSPTAGDIDSSALKSLLGKMRHHGFSCRVGSLNVKQADEELFQMLKAVGQTEVTFAPETTEEMRPRVGKAYISDDKLHTLANYAGKHGFSMNVYSLGGVPGERDEVTNKYADLLRSLRRAMGVKGNLFVHYNPAFMKAQTPFQFFGNIRPAEIRRKYQLIRSRLADEDINFVSVIPGAMTYYQPVLALGDFNAGKIMAHLYKQKRVTEADWMGAFKALGLDDGRYFTAKDPDRTLPWQHIGFTDHQKLRRRASALARSISLPVIDQDVQM